MNRYLPEWSNHLDKILPHLTGCGIDIGSQGLPITRTAIGVDLPHDEFLKYNNEEPRGPIQLPCRGEKLPFNDESLDYVFSSHLLEDFADWTPILKEWVRVLRKFGKLVILIPETERWNAALARGQNDNPAHKHLGSPGELSTYASALGLEVICDKLTDKTPEDYTILFIAQRLP